uniref:Uncharacterized protein n=1 Tax=Candidatus Kentrum sp. TC TaxID=2126339 RepID=A0A450Z269_9GAMM|nr:MAG: hypothetical protein BECKTC1821E_GA0114239_10963 [Candidatus Kentron sp. TC]
MGLKLPCIVHLAIYRSPKLPTDFSEDPKIYYLVKAHQKPDKDLVSHVPAYFVIRRTAMSPS